MPELPSGSNLAIKILRYTGSVHFLRKWIPFLPEILGFNFSDFLCYTPQLFLHQ